MREHHRFLIAQHLSHIDFLDEQIEAFDSQIAERITPPGADQGGPPQAAAEAVQPATEGEKTQVAPAALSWQSAVAIWDSLPGIGQRVAEQLVAEIGPDVSSFPSAAHLASWAKLCPGNHERAGKRYSGRTGKGNVWLRSSLVQAAQAAVRKKDSWLSAYYGRLVARRGAKKAIVAVAHKLLTIGYTLLRNRELYQEPGAAALDQRRADKVLTRLRHTIEQLGYKVTLEPAPAAAA